MTPARKLYLDNIRWITVVLVVVYHVVYMGTFLIIAELTNIS